VRQAVGGSAERLLGPAHNASAFGLAARAASRPTAPRAATKRHSFIIAGRRAERQKAKEKAPLHGRGNSNTVRPRLWAFRVPSGWHGLSHGRSASGEAISVPGRNVVGCTRKFDETSEPGSTLIWNFGVNLSTLWNFFDINTCEHLQDFVLTPERRAAQKRLQ
jgi:hypothetical protein